MEMRRSRSLRRTGSGFDSSIIWPGRKRNVRPSGSRMSSHSPSTSMSAPVKSGCAAATSNAQSMKPMRSFSPEMAAKAHLFVPRDRGKKPDRARRRPGRRSCFLVFKPNHSTLSTFWCASARSLTSAESASAAVGRPVGGAGHGTDAAAGPMPGDGTDAGRRGAECGARRAERRGGATRRGVRRAGRRGGATRRAGAFGWGRRRDAMLDRGRERWARESGGRRLGS